MRDCSKKNKNTCTVNLQFKFKWMQICFFLYSELLQVFSCLVCSCKYEALKKKHQTEQQSNLLSLVLSIESARDFLSLRVNESKQR